MGLLAAFPLLFLFHMRRDAARLARTMALSCVIGNSRTRSPATAVMPTSRHNCHDRMQGLHSLHVALRRFAGRQLSLAGARGPLVESETLTTP